MGETVFYLQGTALAQADRRAEWLEWVRTTASSVAEMSGRFPVDEVIIRLKSVRSSRAIDFARVKRQKTPVLVFNVRPDASLDDLLGNWRGYHEMAHLIIPFPGNRDIWFAEGLASYYQYFLMARSGHLSTEAAWRELVRGLLRGVDDRAGRGQTLRRLAPTMWRQSAFRRVYWTGAAYFLRVDSRLRSESDGRLSVDRALADFVQCCRRRPIDRQWNAERLIEQLGRTGRADIWREEYERMIDAPAAPDFDSALKRVGIVIEPDRSIRFENRPRLTWLRQSIAAGSAHHLQ